MKCPNCGKEIANGSMFCEYCGAQVKKNRKPLFVTFFIVVFALTAIILGVLYYDANQCYYWANQERWEYKNKYETAIRERDNAKSELSSLKNKVSTTYPIIITDIEIANVTYDGDVQTNYGNMIYSYNTMYLKPRIEYTGLTSGDKTIKVKWYNPDGTISSGSSSPSGFSQSQSMYVLSGDNNTSTLSGWGNSSKGNWSKGTYRIEIWYENTCLKAKTFTIH